MYVKASFTVSRDKSRFLMRACEVEQHDRRDGATWQTHTFHESRWLMTISNSLSHYATLN